MDCGNIAVPLHQPDPSCEYQAAGLHIATTCRALATDARDRNPTAPEREATLLETP